jgi:hypothetical protein
MRNVAAAPYLAKDVTISGVVLDDATGALTLVARQEAKGPAEALAPEAEAEVAAGAAAPAEAVAPHPTPQLDLLMTGLGQWLSALETKATWKQEVQKLRRALAATPGALARLKLLEHFARKASGDSKEMIRAFEQIRHQVQSAPTGKVPETLVRFFHRWSGGAS